MMTYAASASRPLCFNTQPTIVKSNGLNSTSASSIIDCSTTTRRKRVGLVKAPSPTRPTLSSNWDFQFVATTTTTSAPRLPRFEELYTTNMLLRQRIIFLGSQVDDMTAGLIISQLLFLDAEDLKKDITLFINLVARFSSFNPLKSLSSFSPLPGALHPRLIQQLIHQKPIRQIVSHLKNIGGNLN